MKIKIGMLMVVFALLATVIYAGGDGEKAAAGAAGEPRYGGKLVYHHRGAGAEPGSADLASGTWSTNLFQAPFMQQLVTGDFEKVGPRGTGEYSFEAFQYIPEYALRGYLAESWELSQDKFVFHIRPGIMWQGNDTIGMKPREFVAQDAVTSLKHYWDSPAVGGHARLFFIQDIYAQDKYTLVIDVSQFVSNWVIYLGCGWCSGMQSPETLKAGPENWDNVTGTGPWMFKEYVQGSHMAYVKNDDYWEKRTINGKEYQLPFIDELVYPIIPDETTRLAALRSGNLDFIESVGLQYEETLAKTNPDLVKYKYLVSDGLYVAFKSSSKYFSNKDLRRAMIIGTDLDAINRAVWMDGEKFGFPIFPHLSTDLYTPLEDCPASIQELYKYDPVKAKKMIADAGYPNGFKLKLDIPTTGKLPPASEMLVGMWDKLGIDLELNVLEAAAYSALKINHNYEDICTFAGAVSDPVHALLEYTTPGQPWNFCELDDPYINKTLSAAHQTVDEGERYAMLKELSLYLWEDAWFLSYNFPFALTYHWPKLKNYYGEIDVDYHVRVPVIAGCWIEE
ncbi:MAG: ABC transporter substrate-binding protein [Spirochaetales bacterium]|nr:ABC transporter substrate-binding protein [Spirochaetales bacterium]